MTLLYGIGGVSPSHGQKLNVGEDPKGEDEGTKEWSGSSVTTSLETIHQVFLRVKVYSFDSILLCSYLGL